MFGLRYQNLREDSLVLSRGDVLGLCPLLGVVRASVPQCTSHNVYYTPAIGGEARLGVDDSRMVDLDPLMP